MQRLAREGDPWREGASAKAQVARAKRAYHEALFARQEVEQRRRYDSDTLLQRETSDTVHARAAPKTSAPPVEAAVGTRTDVEGNTQPWNGTTNEDIHAIFFEYWSPIFQMEHDDVASKAAEQGVLEHTSSTR